MTQHFLPTFPVSSSLCDVACVLDSFQTEQSKCDSRKFLSLTGEVKLNHSVTSLCIFFSWLLDGQFSNPTNAFCSTDLLLEIFSLRRKHFYDVMRNRCHQTLENWSRATEVISLLASVSLLVSSGPARMVRFPCGPLQERGQLCPPSSVTLTSSCCVAVGGRGGWGRCPSVSFRLLQEALNRCVDVPAQRSSSLNSSFVSAY